MKARQKIKRNWWKILLAVLLGLLVLQIPVTGWICNGIFARYDVKAETPIKTYLCHCFLVDWAS